MLNNFLFCNKTIKIIRNNICVTYILNGLLFKIIKKFSISSIFTYELFLIGTLFKKFLNYFYVIKSFKNKNNLNCGFFLLNFFFFLAFYY